MVMCCEKRKAEKSREKGISKDTRNSTQPNFRTV